MCSGKTNHFTNFAILLGGNTDECDDNNNYIFSYLTIAFVAAAILIVLVSFIVIEIYVRLERKTTIREFSRHERTSRDGPVL